MSKNSIRVRFAPAPTGMMHLGNVRTALMNFLFAKYKVGTFVLRIEDTDPERNYDPKAEGIISDLQWLGITHDEGPNIGGPHKPYFQSQRTKKYSDHLNKLIEQKAVYQCFCTEQELAKKRDRQRALKQPPRYDRSCLKLSEADICERMQNNSTFVWRVKLDHAHAITITDLTHGKITFEFKNFSDFPITRSDGSFTFMFANFVDDMDMEITHIFRGDDHLTNTAGQAALYELSGKELPTFWHMPILCNIDGKKLSKRDFGFSLRDLKDAGFTPEAICNYLGIIGASFEQEIMSLDQLSTTLNFENPPSTGQIKYDFEKLRWLNHKWISQYDPTTLAQACKPFLDEAYVDSKIDTNTLAPLLQHIKTDLNTLKDAVTSLAFYFEKPQITQQNVNEHITQKKEELKQAITDHLDQLGNPNTFATSIKQSGKSQGLPLRELFCFIRLALTGKAKGPSIHDLVAILGKKESKKRLESALQLLTSSE